MSRLTRSARAAWTAAGNHLRAWTPLVCLAIFLIQGAQALSARNEAVRLARREQVLDETIRLTQTMRAEFDRQNQNIEIVTQLLKQDIRGLREIKSAMESTEKTTSVAGIPDELRPPQ